MSNLALRRLKVTDPDLASIAAELNAGDNEISAKTFTADSLHNFLTDPNHFYLLALVYNKIAGAAHGYLHLHPAGPKYLYIDEVDTVKAYRRQGVATAMMKEAFSIGRELGATEARLGTEHDNELAKKLYEGLRPSEIENGPIYTYKIKES